MPAAAVAAWQRRSARTRAASSASSRAAASASSAPSSNRGWLHTCGGVTWSLQHWGWVSVADPGGCARLLAQVRGTRAHLAQLHEGVGERGARVGDVLDRAVQHRAVHPFLRRRQLHLARCWRCQRPMVTGRGARACTSWCNGSRDWHSRGGCATLAPQTGAHREPRVGRECALLHRRQLVVLAFFVFLGPVLAVAVLVVSKGKVK